MTTRRSRADTVRSAGVVRRTPVAGALVCAALAFGCGGSAGGSSAPVAASASPLAPPTIVATAVGTAPSSIPPAASTPPVGPAAPARAPTQIATSGVGPIDVDTPDDLDAIRAAFPGFEVARRENAAEDHHVVEYTVTKGGRRALFVVFDHFRAPRPFRVDVLGPPFATERGIGVGSTVAEARAAYPDLACRFERYDPAADIYRVAARLFCATSALPTVQLDLDLTPWRGRPGPVDPTSVQKKPFVRVTWIAPG